MNTTFYKSDQNLNTRSEKSTLFEMHRVPIIKRAQLSPDPTVKTNKSKKSRFNGNHKRPLYLRYIEYS